MSKRKRKRLFFDFFGFGEEDFPFGGKPSEGGSGYSMSVSYDGTGRPIVQVKTCGEVDTAGSRKDIEQKYPGAKIEGSEKKPLIRIIMRLKTKERRVNLELKRRSAEGVYSRKTKCESHFWEKMS
jgi:hypothetical protein